MRSEVAKDVGLIELNQKFAPLPSAGQFDETCDQWRANGICNVPDCNFMHEKPCRIEVGPASTQEELSRTVGIVAIAVDRVVQQERGGSNYQVDSGIKTVSDWAKNQDQFNHLPTLPEGWVRTYVPSNNTMYYFEVINGKPQLRGGSR